MRKVKKLLLRTSALGAVFFVGLSWASPAIPELTSPVIDEAGILTSSERLRLEGELYAYPPQAQIQVWILPSLQGDAIENVSIRAVETWKLGTKKDDNGILITVAVQDRRMRIEVGQGLEGNITDLQAGRIVDYTLRPAFRDGRFFEGLRDASRQLYTLAGGTNKKFQAQEPRPMRRDRAKLFVSLFIFGLFILITFLRLVSGVGFRGRRGYWGGGGGWGGVGGWGGGGGWSGGGGSFSGGGSSGSW